MDELVAEGKWKLKEMIKFFRYDKLGDEVVGRYQKVEVKCFAYETLSTPSTNSEAGLYSISQPKM